MKHMLTAWFGLIVMHGQCYYYYYYFIIILGAYWGRFVC